MNRWPNWTDDEYREYWVTRVRARCVINESGCWIWQGFCAPFGNMKPGQIGYGTTSYRGKPVHTHRKMLEIKLGKVLTRKDQACHTCDNPPCCNPDHLWLGTNSQNMKDSGAKGRHSRSMRTHCAQGHPFDAENTRITIDKFGGKHRACKTCQRIIGRLKLGWSEAELSAPPIPVGAPTKRRYVSSR